MNDPGLVPHQSDQEAVPPHDPQADLALIPNMPYKGIAPFRYVDQLIFPGQAAENFKGRAAENFKGRAAENLKLLQYMTIYRGTLLYGSSGSGKSSLINAMFIPKTITEGFIPHRIRIQPHPAAELVVEQIPSTESEHGPYLPTIFADDLAEAQCLVLAASTFKEKIKAYKGSSIPLLIFDQFEEFVTLFEEIPQSEALGAARETQKTILDLLIWLLRNQLLPVKLLFVFREDYLAKLTKLFLAYPNLTDQYVRLRPLQVDDLDSIIHAPFQTATLTEHFGRVLPKQVAEELHKQLQRRSPNNELNLSEIQIACLELWQASNPAQLLEQKGLQGILDEYFDRILHLLSSANLLDPALAILNGLITASGIRTIAPAQELSSRIQQQHLTSDLVTHVLNVLEAQAKLVRRESRAGVDVYELVSDTLVPWVRQQAAANRAFRDSRRLEELERRRKAPAPISLERSPVPDAEDLLILLNGTGFWNNWRRANPDICPSLSQAMLQGQPLSAADFSKTDLSAADLSETDLSDVVLRGANLYRAILRKANLTAADITKADLTEADLTQADLRKANLTAADITKADLTEADLTQADLQKAKLNHAYLTTANLSKANLRGTQLQETNLKRANFAGADLRGADLTRADLTGADLSGANLAGANLSYTTLVDTNLSAANISNCVVTGVITWNLNLTGTIQSALTISHLREPAISVDDLKVALFMQLILSDHTIRAMIPLTTPKSVLVLGMFVQEQSQLLDAIRTTLHAAGYVPIVANLHDKGPGHSEEAITVLASLSRFAIVEITRLSQVDEVLDLLIAQALPIIPLHERGKSTPMPLNSRTSSWLLSAVPYDAVAELSSLMRESLIPAVEQHYRESQPWSQREQPLEEAQRQDTTSSTLETDLSEEQKLLITRIALDQRGSSHITLDDKTSTILAQDPSLKGIIHRDAGENNHYLDVIALGERERELASGTNRLGSIARYLLGMLRRPAHELSLEIGAPR